MVHPMAADNTKMVMKCRFCIIVTITDAGKIMIWGKQMPHGLLWHLIIEFSRLFTIYWVALLWPVGHTHAQSRYLQADTRLLQFDILYKKKSPAKPGRNRINKQYIY